MTLEEAIEYHERIDKIETQARFLISQEDGDHESHKRCAEEHRQLAEWLKELKALKEQEPILDKIRAEIEEAQTYKMFEGEGTVYVKRDDVLTIIDKYKAESEGRDDKRRSNRDY